MLITNVLGGVQAGFGLGFAPTRRRFCIQTLLGSGVTPSMISASRFFRIGLGVATCTISYFAGFPGTGTPRFDIAPLKRKVMTTQHKIKSTYQPKSFRFGAMTLLFKSLFVKMLEIKR